MGATKDAKGRPLFKPMKPGTIASTAPFLDSHVHLDSIMKYAVGEDVAMAEFKRVCLDSGMFGGGFTGAVHVALAPDGIETSKELVRLHPDIIHPCWGVHPLNADRWTDDVGRDCAELVADSHSVGWGECGLDYFYNTCPHDMQMSVFEKQLRLASATGKPVVIHSRDAEEDTFTLMKKVLPDGYPIHLHCFTGSKEYAERMLSSFSGLKIGLTGTLTFRNATHLREVAGRIIPPHRLLMETDGPFMAPVPFRGTISHPGLIPTIAAAVADARREFGTDPTATVDSVLLETYNTAKEFYHI